CSPLFVLGSGIFATIGILAIIAAAVFNGVFKPTSGAVVDSKQKGGTPLSTDGPSTQQQKANAPALNDPNQQRQKGGTIRHENSNKRPNSNTLNQPFIQPAPGVAVPYQYTSQIPNSNSWVNQPFPSGQPSGMTNASNIQYASQFSPQTNPNSQPCSTEPTRRDLRIHPIVPQKNYCLTQIDTSHLPINQMTKMDISSVNLSTLTDPVQKVKYIHACLGIELCDIPTEVRCLIPDHVDFSKFSYYAEVSDSYGDFTRFRYAVHGPEAVSAWISTFYNGSVLLARESFTRPADVDTTHLSNIDFDAADNSGFTAIPTPKDSKKYFPAFHSRCLVSNPKRSAYNDPKWIPSVYRSVFIHDQHCWKQKKSRNCQFAKAQTQPQFPDNSPRPSADARIDNKAPFSRLHEQMKWQNGETFSVGQPLHYWIHSQGEVDQLPDRHWLPSVFDWNQLGINQYDFSRITDLNAAYRCYVSNMPYPNDLNFFEAMHQEKISFVVDLVSDNDLMVHDNSYELAVKQYGILQPVALQKIIHFQGPNREGCNILVDEYTYISRVDRGTRTIVRLRMPNISDGSMGENPRFIEFCANYINHPNLIDARFEGLEKGYVFHCVAGLGRSPTMMAYCTLCRARELARNMSIPVIADFERDAYDLIKCNRQNPPVIALNLVNVLRRIMTQGYFARSSFIQRGETQLKWLVERTIELANSV
ncbi:MAG: hypothetical protein LBI69_01690, partial [Puniceicoccales bacterium]|nr:hypothetical protein [Puniceicoccales bacterium]